jgi:mono/diheme cytochrome c family protein
VRHFLANVAIYGIAMLLLAGAALFAWARSAQLTVTDEAAVLAAFAPAEDSTFHWRELGAESYARNCRTCHLRDGSGWDQYPPLDHTSTLAATPTGRAYVIDVHLYGLASDRWRAPMPPMGHLHDVELAAVLNHVLTAFGATPVADDRLYRPEDIAARRGQALSPHDVDARRPE